MIFTKNSKPKWIFFYLFCLVHRIDVFRFRKRLIMSDENDPTTFEEAYERYIEYRTRFEHLENEFDEYQQSSLNYEQELEVQLKQLDNQTHRYQQDLFVERTQNEQYRERTEQTIKQFDKRFDQIQEELNACKNLNEKLTHYIRELEQTNDDLERSKERLEEKKLSFFQPFLFFLR